MHIDPTGVYFQYHRTKGDRAIESRHNMTLIESDG